ncbi:MAG TPA: arabinan endo-1,5-alpha-L-arabinosidase [Armatimonadota bacterium]
MQLSPACADAEKAKEPEFNAIINVHDPNAIKAGKYYYVFSTGPEVMIRRSKDLVHWTYVGSAFPGGTPGWALKEIPGARSDSIWAPSISKVNGQYRLYYAVSRFGRNRSVIGLATNKTLDPDSKDYRWVDQGKVVESQTTDDFNAIDPAFCSLDDKRGVLSFGSYWSGIKAVQISVKTGKPPAGAKTLPIAQRPFPDALEGPEIVHIGAHYYLFVSFDTCCQGINSTYNIRVGRSTRWDGPYVDKDGVSLMQGGGTLLLATADREIGPGHCSVLADGSKRWLVYHFYDRDNNGIPTLQLRPLSIGKNGWPVLGSPLIPARP